ncbi:hypothetical protein, partial [Phaeobacter sp. B1627]|uniref:hypothetical protein n=1 Tax=Phaeobacter sp. B1627 TaxID=2583809 RepID=UPI001C400E3E
IEVIEQLCRCRLGAHHDEILQSPHNRLNQRTCRTATKTFSTASADCRPSLQSRRQSFALAKAAIQALPERNLLAALSIKVSNAQKPGFAKSPAVFAFRAQIDPKPPSSNHQRCCGAVRRSSRWCVVQHF